VYRRLLLTYVSLLTSVLFALEIPLAATIASRDTQHVFIDRLNDTARYASVAEEAVRSGRALTLEAELRRYGDTYGIDAFVVDRDRQVIAQSSDFIDMEQPDVRARLDAALAGGRETGRVVWPWSDAPLVVAEPVDLGGEVLGAVVTISPTDQLRSRTARGWAVLAAVGLLTLALSWLAAVPVTRWVLRPVHDLDEAAHGLTAGNLQARVSGATGPIELQRLAHSFNVMADTVVESLERQRAFVAQASHQLRNPLTALQLRVENLTEYVGAAGEEELHIAMEESARLARILDALLALARAESGQVELETVDTAQAIVDRVAAWRPVAERRSARVTAMTAGGPAYAVCQAGALDQVLDALVDNALKFGPPGVTVALSAAQNADGTVEVHVRDDGPGLADDERQQATARFWRGRADQNIEGSGLGLSVVAALLKASGGALDLLPNSPSGLDARVTLRAAAPDDHGLTSR
jgi:signal transduction histidine kinase